MKSNKEKYLLEIDRLTSQFFNVFNNKNENFPDLKELKTIFIKEGMIINNNDGEPIIYDVDSFINPRAEILSNGTLTDFSEEEVSNKTSIFGNIAQRFCLYKKSGKLNGEYFESEGMKSIQFIKVKDQWKMTCVVWSDKK